VGIIKTEASRLKFLMDSIKLDEDDKKDYNKIKNLDPISVKANSEIVSENNYYLTNSLKILSRLLEKHFGQKTVILIDEYDVPLDKAHQSGFYREMVTLIRNLLGNALKTNDSLAFAVLTGCLRISKESIFTGLNNLAVQTITDKTPGAYFGFTEKEVAEMLAYYDMTNQSDLVREWYDGYKFGSSYMYCPWDVINFCSDLNDAREADLNHDTNGKCAREFLLIPKNYWINTSANSLIRSFIDMADGETRQALEKLVAGESVEKQINENLTYEELYNSIDNLWSVLFTTGYLTVDDYLPDGSLKLRIPNKEIRELYVLQIQEWFKDVTRSDNETLHSFCMAFLNGEPEKIEEQLNDYLWESISIRDTASRNAMKENFYHGLLLGLLKFESRWITKSNKESGTGYPDLLIETPERTGIVIELKYAESGDLEKACDEALLQIEEKKYEEIPRRDRMKKVIKYGIAFYKKDCMVKMSKQ
jgi:putative IMPACT (imprinted ancient) family translation regulator